jgi:hypothetical protein
MKLVNLRWILLIGFFVGPVWAQSLDETRRKAESGHARAQFTSTNEDLQIKPLKDSLAAVEKGDVSEMGYFGLRAGVLYGAIVLYMQDGMTEEQRADKNQQSGLEKLRASSELYMQTGALIDTTSNRMDLDGIKRRQEIIFKYYLEELARGKRLNNDAFTPLILSDLESANKMLATFKAIMEVFKEAASKDSK